ncbi:hypothetical protein NCAS_0E02120 [Naumovozyma castellii]|uniref:WSC domain-containing protein n=1 Tax=Naumovozyma castellii TaxID=27288 RepID=G0VFL5_NAUCA|nr:hypothetical protein NCAS_0E02120 [Naumovozyma castellii CBS 4309]CCC70282.1 hypothetical protein NCAS_0E02120 [Naumovozyma castellii CBS 4309]
MLLNKIGLLLTIQGLCSKFASSQDTASTYINCFASLPSDFSLDNSYAYQASSYCHDKCLAKGSSYFALFNHGDCYCGNSNPTNSESTSSSCNTYCYGYDQEMCGGTSSYSVYSIGTPSDDDTSSVSSKSGTTTLSSSTNSQSSASKGSTTSQSSSTSLNTGGSTSLSSQGTSAGTSTLQETTSVVYQTEIHTEGGSTIYLTNTITKSSSAQETGSANSTTTGKSTNAKKKTNVGAIVGGVVGGVCGAIIVAVVILFMVRHINMRREEARMEKEYQEAIKPVEFNDYDTTTSVPGGGIVRGDSLMTNNDVRTNNTAYASSLTSQGLPLTSSFVADERLPPHPVSNPFDDSRRISNGSILHGPTSSGGKVLTVVNPDEVD